MAEVLKLLKKEFKFQLSDLTGLLNDIKYPEADM
jgi:hypothetical protein